jgi:hypothetical protein
MQQKKDGSDSCIIVGDVKIPTEIRLLPVADLRYYKDNPRIFSILKGLGDGVTQEEIERELWGHDHTKELFQDIKQNGGLLEEIIVRGHEVLEGNSRLCAYRHLLKNAKEAGDKDAITKWSLIRAKVLPNDVTERAVFAILGLLHIRGKAQWRPFEQASYLFRQTDTHRMTTAELAAQIGGGIKEADVRNMIDAYKMMEKYKDTDISRFSYYFEFVKSRKLDEVKEYLPQNCDLEKEFSGWVKNGTFPRAEAVRDLPTILKDKSAKVKFLGGKLSFDDALDLAKEHHPEAGSPFYNKLKKATEAMNNAEEARIREEVSQDRQKKNVIRDLAKTAKRFARSVGIDL